MDLSAYDSVYLAYLGALVVSGIIMLVLAATGFGSGGALARVLNGLFGLGFLGYAVYLVFFDTSDTYRMFYYAFILPVLMLIQAFKNRGAKEEAPAS
jgi:hypothetical protein